MPMRALIWAKDGPARLSENSTGMLGFHQRCMQRSVGNDGRDRAGQGRWVENISVLPPGYTGQDPCRLLSAETQNRTETPCLLRGRLPSGLEPAVENNHFGLLKNLPNEKDVLR